MSILSDRDITPDERAAIADEPRPGVWVEQFTDGTPSRSPNDGRALSQLETDQLVVLELVGRSGVDPDEIAALIPPKSKPAERFILLGAEYYNAHQQRGGIHSEPIVRLLAFRAWGERDRAWRKRDTLRTLFPEPQFGLPGLRQACCRVYGFDDLDHGSVRGGVDVRVERGSQRASAEVRFASGSPVLAAMFEDYLTALEQLDLQLGPR